MSFSRQGFFGFWIQVSVFVSKNNENALRFISLYSNNDYFCSLLFMVAPAMVQFISLFQSNHFPFHFYYYIL